MAKIKKVYKYGTGEEIPEGAVYLSTQVETKTEHQQGGKGSAVSFTMNKWVWHYFLVEVEN
ncbi:hypothetical protein LCGC14_1351180 [marine sediment metagenome]|uniref:Uncharacterized protein n=1 Tax=marine sediment metagenome TaxID=412755 RepID=A0A0F9MRQ1_9ZZZZ